MGQWTVLRHLVWTTAILAVGVVMAGCENRGAQPPAEPQAAAQPRSETTPGPEPGAPQIEPGPTTEAKPESVEGSDPESESEPPAGTTTQPEADPEPAIEPKSEAESAPAAEPVREPTPDPGPEAPQAESESAAEGITEAEPQMPPAVEPESEPEPAAPDDRKAPDLGPPLVQDPKGLRRLDKTRPVWIDMAKKRVVIVGQICQRDALLELFACLRATKEHEAIVSVDVEAATVHAGLVAMGAKPGSPARWEADEGADVPVGSGLDPPPRREPKYYPATGTEIEVTVVWNDKKGKRKTARAQDWILDTQTKKAMAHPWVFAGSRFWKDPETGKKYYQAEGGDLICVSNFPSAMLDLPIESSQATEALMFRAFAERIPPLGTPVTLLLTPKLPKKEEPKEKKAQDEARKAE